MATHSSILAWKIHGQRSLVGYSLWGHNELDMAERLNNSKVTFIILESRQIVKVKVIGSSYYTGVLFYSFVYLSCAGSSPLLAGRR